MMRNNVPWVWTKCGCTKRLFWCWDSGCRTGCETVWPISHQQLIQRMTKVNSHIAISFPGHAVIFENGINVMIFKQPHCQKVPLRFLKSAMRIDFLSQQQVTCSDRQHSKHITASCCQTTGSFLKWKIITRTSTPTLIKYHLSHTSTQLSINACTRAHTHTLGAIQYVVMWIFTQTHTVRGAIIW